MDTLNKLISQKVIATIESENKRHEIEGLVIGVDVNDYYFYEKSEPIFVTVSVNPTKEFPNEIDIEELHEISLGNIRKA